MKGTNSPIPSLIFLLSKDISHCKVAQIIEWMKNKGWSTNLSEDESGLSVGIYTYLTPRDRENLISFLRDLLGTRPKREEEPFYVPNHVKEWNFTSNK